MIFWFPRRNARSRSSVKSPARPAYFFGFPLTAWEPYRSALRIGGATRHHFIPTRRVGTRNLTPGANLVIHRQYHYAIRGQAPV